MSTNSTYEILASVFTANTLNTVVHDTLEVFQAVYSSAEPALRVSIANLGTGATAFEGGANITLSGTVINLNDDIRLNSVSATTLSAATIVSPSINYIPKYYETNINLSSYSGVTDFYINTGIQLTTIYSSVLNFIINSGSIDETTTKIGIIISGDTATTTEQELIFMDEFDLSALSSGYYNFSAVYPSSSFTGAYYAADSANKYTAVIHVSSSGTANWSGASDSTQTVKIFYF